VSRHWFAICLVASVHFSLVCGAWKLTAYQLSALEPEWFPGQSPSHRLPQPYASHAALVASVSALFVLSFPCGTPTLCVLSSHPAAFLICCAVNSVLHAMFIVWMFRGLDDDD